MKLLILTQKVDRDDAILGFFHRWIEEFANKFESIHVVCLAQGKYNLPDNVQVHSLGKEEGVSRLMYVWRFYKYIWKLRRDYDGVFVHMNEEYVILGGLLWRLWGKRSILERNHKIGTWMTPIACSIVNVVDYTSPNSFTARYHNAIRTPIGTDTNFFSPGDDSPNSNSILFLGRIDPVKRVEVFIEAMRTLAGEGVDAHADIYGDPTPGNEQYAEELKQKYGSLMNISFHPGVPNTETLALYRAHNIYVNITPSGSFDKTIGEAMASGAVVVCMNDAVRDILPEGLMAGHTAETTAQAIRTALALDISERQALTARCRAWIEREHSLKLLGEWLLKTLT